jgi:hypothetical protein
MKPLRRLLLSLQTGLIVVISVTLMILLTTSAATTHISQKSHDTSTWGYHAVPKIVLLETAPIGSESSAVTSSPGVIDVFGKMSQSQPQLLPHFFFLGHRLTSQEQSQDGGPFGATPQAVVQINSRIPAIWCIKLKIHQICGL